MANTDSPAAMTTPIAGVPEDLARALARGIVRMMGDSGRTSLCEFTLRNSRRADVIALAPDGLFTIIEIKTTPADFRSDQKWPEYLEFCDYFYFAVPESFPETLIPESCGLIIADAYGGVIRRPSGEDRLNPARRRALTLRYAQSASRRLMQLLDPAKSL